MTPCQLWEGQLQAGWLQKGSSTRARLSVIDSSLSSPFRPLVLLGAPKHPLSLMPLVVPCP